MKGIGIIAILSLILSFNVSADVCFGSEETCAKTKEIDALEKITGETCVGGQEACLEFLREEYETMKFDYMVDQEAERLAGQRKTKQVTSSKGGFEIPCVEGEKTLCLRVDSENNPIWFNINTPPKGIYCVQSDYVLGCFEHKED